MDLICLERPVHDFFKFLVTVNDIQGSSFYDDKKT